MLELFFVNYALWIVSMMHYKFCLGHLMSSGDTSALLTHSTQVVWSMYTSITRYHAFLNIMHITVNVYGKALQINNIVNNVFIDFYQKN